MAVQSLYFDGNLLKIALCTSERGAFKIESLRSFPRGNEQQPSLSAVFSHAREKEAVIVTGLEGGDCVFRQISLSLTGKRKVMQALPFQLEGTIPYPLEEAVVAPLFFSCPGSTLVNLFATTQGLVQRHLESFKEQGIDPHSVSAVPQALWRFCQKFAPREPHVHVVHFGMDRIAFLSIVDHKLSLSHTIPHGVQAILDALRRDFGMGEQEFQQKIKDVPLGALNIIELPHLQKTLLQFKKDIDRIFSYLQTKTTNEETPLLLLGNLFSPLKSDDLIRPLFPASCRLLELEETGSLDRAMLQTYAVPIGLALDAMKKDQLQVQFRQKGLLHPQAVYNQKRNKIIYAASCLVASLAMWAGSSYFLKERSEGLKQQVLRSASVLKDKSGDVAGLTNAWETALSAHKKTFSYYPTVPVVSDVLAWLCAHPLLAFSKEEKEQIEIKAFSYHLKEYPTMDSPAKGYRAEVEMELLITSSKLAKKFHDALLQERRMIDQKQKISWKEEGNIYRVTFAMRSLFKGGPR